MDANRIEAHLRRVDTIGRAVDRAVRSAREHDRVQRVFATASRAGLPIAPDDPRVRGFSGHRLTPTVYPRHLAGPDPRLGAVVDL